MDDASCELKKRETILFVISAKYNSLILQWCGGALEPMELATCGDAPSATYVPSQITYF